jgi:mannose-1-phosphate guanylyltransferase/mannose-1-phosphate guanylyltransferase/phosphomannomutase
MDMAFVLGAGLGTRLRPLTDQLPKPLIPFFHRPLIMRVFDHLRAAGARRFVVNTHHLPERYAEVFPRAEYAGAPITFRHEPVLLETAGGIANIADLVGDESFIVYNGDILTDLPLEPLWRAHREGGNLVTLVLRSDGPARHIAFDSRRGLVTDIRGKLGSGDAGSHQFTGIYAVSPAFLRLLTPGKIESVVHPWLEALKRGERIGGVVVDEGHWCDLGDRESYLNAHRDFAPLRVEPIAAGAEVHPTAVLRGLNVISAQAVVGAGATIEDCILWEGARVAEGATLRRCVVRRGMTARGALENADV